MEQNNGKQWDKNFILALLAFIVGTIVALATPEIRQCIGLEDKPAPVEPVETEATSGPFSATLHENQPHSIKAAKTDLSIVFNKELGMVTLTIAPAGKEEITLPTVGIGSQEFASSTGVFLVHVLNVDWNSRTVTVQVSRKL
ncbi:hypothetical protein [Candidatus Electronema sp. PJ]|uniref:hypothetical protein n=1 Tax=Candidatus Electronema sp. PJ TaxID=3401572 RepID=UPI003AA96856